MAGISRPPPSSSSSEFIATGSRDKTIRLWDTRGTLFKTLTGHDNWVRALVFHPGGKYLLSVSDDKSIRCWDLSQEGRCVKTVDDAHGHFVNCIRWAPPQIKEDSQRAGTETNGDRRPNGVAKKEDPLVGIRCVIATGSVDMSVKIWASWALWTEKTDQTAAGLEKDLIVMYCSLCSCTGASFYGREGQSPVLSAF